MLFATNLTLLCESLRYFTLFHWKAVLFCQCFVLIGEIFAIDCENLVLFREISNFSRKSFRYWKKNCGVSVKVRVIGEKFCIITRVFMSFIAWFELLCKILMLLVYAVVLTIKSSYYHVSDPFHPKKSHLWPWHQQFNFKSSFHIPFQKPIPFNSTIPFHDSIPFHTLHDAALMCTCCTSSWS